MKNNMQGMAWHGVRVMSAGVLATVMLAGGSPATANESKSTFVSGNSTYSDCGLEGSDVALAMTGDLEGCWSVFVQGFKCKELDGYDLYLENGREVFIGKYRGKQGRFATDYTLDAVMAKGFCQSFDFTLEVAGGCDHKIHGRSGVFDGAEGRIKFLDVIAGVTGDPVSGTFNAGTGANNFPYYGRISFDQAE
jgi:hypothetical protein